VSYPQMIGCVLCNVFCLEIKSFKKGLAGWSRCASSLLSYESAKATSSPASVVWLRAVVENITFCRTSDIWTHGRQSCTPAVRIPSRLCGYKRKTPSKRETMAPSPSVWASRYLLALWRVPVVVRRRNLAMSKSGVDFNSESHQPSPFFSFYYFISFLRLSNLYLFV